MLPALEVFSQINHIYQLYPCIIYRMVIIVCKEVFNAMRTNKSAPLIKWDCQRTISCANLQDRIFLFIGCSNKVDERFTVPLSLISWLDSKIFNFKDTVPFVSDYTFTLNSIIIQNIHRSSIKIPVYHILLFVCQQQQRKKLFFVFLNFFYFHINTRSKPRFSNVDEVLLLKFLLL